MEQYRQRKRHGPYSAALILLDADRIEDDRSRSRDPSKGLGGEDLHLNYQKPNNEGLLIRLHRGHENRFVSTSEVNRALKRPWPNYAKPISAEALSRRFGLSDLQRAARYDFDLRQMLEILGLRRRK